MSTSAMFGMGAGSGAIQDSRKRILAHLHEPSLLDGNAIPHSSKLGGFLVAVHTFGALPLPAALRFELRAVVVAPVDGRA